MSEEHSSGEYAGATAESLLVTDEVEDMTKELSSPVRARPRCSNIEAIRKESIDENSAASENSALMTKSESFCSDKEAFSDSASAPPPPPDPSGSGDELDYFHDSEWLSKSKHVFVLSTAGKPIYSLHGNEDKLATLSGVMQALVSVVSNGQGEGGDSLKSIQAAGCRFVFLVKSPLILVAVSRTKSSVQQLQMQLTDVYHQILSTITLSHMLKIYENRKNFDLRRLLAGSERLIDHLLVSDTKTKVSNNPFIFLTHSIRILPLSTGVRDSVVGAIQNNCAKIKNLVFAILIASNKLIALVRMKKYFIHPSDLRIIFNLVESTESFKSSESWTPICLPKFDSNGFLHAHVSYLADDCQACLLLLSVERDVFFTLSEAKKKITDKLRRSNCLEAINEAIGKKGISLQAVGIPEIRHFLYRCRSTAQLLCSEISAPYNTPTEFERLQSIYYELHHRIHCLGRPLKLIYEQREKEIFLVWVTQGYELFVTFEPIVDRVTVITLVNKLLKWIKKEEDYLFILNAPTF